MGPVPARGDHHPRGEPWWFSPRAYPAVRPVHGHPPGPCLHGLGRPARSVEVGHRNPFHAEVLSGVEAGQAVILHPDDRLEDGTRVAVR